MDGRDFLWEILWCVKIYLVKIYPSALFFTEFSEFLIKLVNPTGRIYKFHLTGKEWMREAGNFHFNQRILISILPNHCFPGGSAGFGQN